MISGRYILEPEIFELLEKGEKGAGGEIQLTDAMIKLAATQPFHGVRFDGKTYDTGSKLGFLAANIAFGLERPDIADGLRAEIKRLLG
jgi:UTP--glucose-1-phosphate uridylyltransferase